MFNSESVLGNYSISLWDQVYHVPFYISRWNEEMQKDVHLFFYLADENGNALSLGGDILDIHENSLLASGSRTDIGEWQLHLKSKVEGN